MFCSGFGCKGGIFSSGKELRAEVHASEDLARSSLLRFS